MDTRHAIIKGVVQGVFFRDYTRKQALSLNIKGWVRNLPDGSVECLITGQSNEVTRMIDWLWQGSPMSRVKDIIVCELPVDTSSTSFEIRR